MDSATVQYPILFFAALAAGWVDSIAGGGGLISLPALLSAGLPPQMALGTNKLQSSCASAVATWRYIRAGTFRLADCKAGLPAVAAGAALGAWSVQLLSAALLRQLIPWLLLALAVYTLLSPRLGDQDRHPRLKPELFFLTAGTTLGFYDGFFGPGAGSFWVVMVVLITGYNLTKATGVTKLMNFTSNIVSLLVFLAGGQVNILIGLLMAAGGVLGARLGAGMVIVRGSRLVRPMLIVISLAITVRLFLT